MNKDTFDTAMKLNHGRTVTAGDNVCLKIDNKNNFWFKIISILSKEEGIYMEKINGVETIENYLDNLRYNGRNKTAIRFDEFLIRFKEFYNYGRV